MEQFTTLPALDADVTAVALPPAKYDPYTYLPMQRAFFMTGNFTDLPDEAYQLSQEQPGLRQHIDSVWSFLSWMKDTNPELYAAVSNERPELVDPAVVVESGALTISKNKSFGLKGLRGLADVTADATATSTSDFGSVVSGWGKDLLGTIKEIAPAYFQLESQKSLMEINISRAEQGLAPIDSSGFAPTVNMGLSPGVIQMGYIAIGGLVLVGLYAAFAKAKK